MLVIVAAMPGALGVPFIKGSGFVSFFRRQRVEDEKLWAELEQCAEFAAAFGSEEQGHQCCRNCSRQNINGLTRASADFV